MLNLKEYTSTLDCILSEAKVLEYGRELASVSAAIGNEESNQQSIRKEMASRLAGLEAKAGELSSKINRGKELREVRIVVEGDMNAGIAREIRMDTGEVIRERPLRDEERQQQIPVSR